MNILDRITSMYVTLQELHPTTEVSVRLKLRRGHLENEKARWNASISDEHGSNGETPDAALRRLDERLTSALETRIARNQEKIDAARAAMAGSVPTGSGEGK